MDRDAPKLNVLRNSSMLVVNAGGIFCALPSEQVIETMRPLTIEAFAGLPPFVLGLAPIRGQSVPVVELGSLLNNKKSNSSGARFVTVRLGGRSLALRVDAVVGMRVLGTEILESLPPLLGNLHSSLVSKIGQLDHEFLLVLETSRVLSEELWSKLMNYERP